MQRLSQSPTQLSASTPPRLSTELHTAVAAQFGEALETLLFSLRHIDAKIVTSKWAGPAQSSMRELTETALREISWFSEILKRLGHDPKAQKAASGSITRNTEDHHSGELSLI